MNVQNLKEAHQTILEVYSILVNSKDEDTQEEMYKAIIKARQRIEQEAAKALGRAKDNT